MCIDYWSTEKISMVHQLLYRFYQGQLYYIHVYLPYDVADAVPKELLALHVYSPWSALLAWFIIRILPEFPPGNIKTWPLLKQYKTNKTIIIDNYAYNCFGVKW
jgi:hypothetical protein